MSLWSERERNIFILKLGGAEKKFDPLKIGRAFNRAVTECGGWEAFKRHWMMQWSTKEDSDTYWASWHESAEALAVIGRSSFGLQEWSEENPDGVTADEAIQCLAQWLVYSQKKDQGAEKSPISSTDSAPGPDETKKESPTTPTS